MKKPKILWKFIATTLFGQGIASIIIKILILKKSVFNDLQTEITLLDFFILIGVSILAYYILIKGRKNIKIIEEQTNEDIWRPNVMKRWWIYTTCHVIINLYGLMTNFKFRSNMIILSILLPIAIATIVFYIFLCYELYKIETLADKIIDGLE